jgi:hypothetical protein
MRAEPPRWAAPFTDDENIWKPGQSGNPEGNSGLYGETVKLAHQAAPDAIRRLIELMRSEDERVAAVACNSILDRAFGKPKVGGEEKDDFVARLEAMTPEERAQLARQLLEEGRLYLPAYRESERKRSRATAERGDGDG